MKLFWKFLAWLSLLCGLATFGVGWYALLIRKSEFFVPTEFWFYDGIASGIFGLFFLIYGVYGSKEE